MENVKFSAINTQYNHVYSKMLRLYIMCMPVMNVPFFDTTWNLFEKEMLVVLFSCAIHSFEPHAEDFIHILTFSVVICVGAYSAIFVFDYFSFHSLKWF